MRHTMAENETFRFLKPFRKWLSAFSGVRQTHVPSRFSSGFGHVRARFDAAQTTADNARHWIMADSLSADAEANADVRRILRIRSRYEIANNSYAKGLVLMLANDTVGTGPRLQLLTENEPFNDEAENDFSEWMRAVKLPRKLRLMRISRCQDGEAFGILTTNPEIRGGVKLDLRLIEADRVCGEFSGGDEENAADGVYRDQWGNPKAYRVLKTHPGDNRAAWNGSENEAEMIPAEYMIHAFLQNRPEQHRGIPEL